MPLTKWAWICCFLCDKSEKLLTYIDSNKSWQRFFPSFKSKRTHTHSYRRGNTSSGKMRAGVVVRNGQQQQEKKPEPTKKKACNGIFVAMMMGSFLECLSHWMAKRAHTPSTKRGPTWRKCVRIIIIKRRISVNFLTGYFCTQAHTFERAKRRPHGNGKLSKCMCHVQIKNDPAMYTLYMCM